MLGKMLEGKYGWGSMFTAGVITRELIQELEKNNKEKYIEVRKKSNKMDYSYLRDLEAYASVVWETEDPEIILEKIASMMKQNKLENELKSGEKCPLCGHGKLEISEIIKPFLWCPDCSQKV